MWCSDCQQDVPAVAGAANQPLLCSRCQRELTPDMDRVPSDAGIELESFDQTSQDDWKPPIDWLTQQQTNERLREIDRQLSSPYQEELPQIAVARRSSPSANSNTPPAPPLPTVTARTAQTRADNQPPARSSWLLSLLLILGAFGFLGGVCMLGWSAAFQLTQLWQQGMTLTIAAEGLLILSLTWMAIRLWRNGRRVNRQLDGVDQQLADIEHITGTLAGTHTTSSQHYYHHFNQAASPHMLVANLQGQVDQLASRLGG